MNETTKAEVVSLDSPLCGTCRYCSEPEGLNPTSLKREYFCRSGPPHASLAPGPQGPMLIGLFPPVNPDRDWCGEWRRRDSDIN